MHPDKTPGPDDLNPAFFQGFWEVIGKDVSNDFREWLRTGLIPEEVQASNIVLLPRKENPTRMFTM
ncbi:hypothetical protein LINPERHAP1_LOCUS9212 [Linum perenne]